jgi:hypothetical protein
VTISDHPRFGDFESGVGFSRNNKKELAPHPQISTNDEGRLTARKGETVVVQRWLVVPD